jgi:hypothetical protein
MKILSRGLLLGLALLGAWGCSEADLSTSATMELPKVPITGIKIASRSMPSQFGLFNGKKLVPIGGNREVFNSAFPRPSRGFPLEEVVPGLPKEFVSEGWETDREGAGMITYDGQIVLVMHQYEALDAGEFAEILKVSQSGFGDKRFKYWEEPQADYWFCEDENDACVISRLRGSKKTYQVTVTAGDRELLTFLKIYRNVTNLPNDYAK